MRAQYPQNQALLGKWQSIDIITTNKSVIIGLQIEYQSHFTMNGS